MKTRADSFQTPGKVADRPPSFRELLTRLAEMEPIVVDQYEAWSCLFCRMVFPAKKKDRRAEMHMGQCLWRQARLYLGLPLDPSTVVLAEGVVP